MRDGSLLEKKRRVVKCIDKRFDFKGVNAEQPLPPSELNGVKDKVVKMRRRIYES